MPKWMRSNNDDKKLKKERERYQAKIADYGEGYTGAPVDFLMRLDPNTLNQLPAETLEKLPLARLRYLSVDALARLSPETLSGLPPEDICRLPSEKLATLPPGALAKLAPGFLSKLHPSQLGMVLPELEPEVLTTISPTAIAKVDPRQLANIPPQGLASLAKRYPDLLLGFQDLPHEQLLRLPHFILSRLPLQAFKSIPAEIWEHLPDEIWMNLPPEVRKILSEERAGSNKPKEQPPTVASVERQYRPSSPTAPPFPVPFEQDGSLLPKQTPPIPPRHRAGPPLSSQNASVAPRRTNSQRSRPSSPSQTFRNKASLYMEGSSPPTERKDSLAMRDGGDSFREDLLNHRPVPQIPDGMHRKEVADTWKDHMIEKLTNDVSAKDRVIEDLTTQIEDKERWNQEMDDERGNLANDVSAKDKVIEALTTQIKDKERWNQKMDEERDNLSAQVIELKVAKQSSAERMFNCLAKIVPTMALDRSQSDPTELILNYLESLHRNASENFTLATELRKQLQSQQVDLDANSREARVANDELTTLRYSIKQYEKQLLSVDANNATWKMTENSLIRERDELSIQVNDLRKRLEKEKDVAKTNLANQHAHHEAQTKDIKQHNLDLQRELKEQNSKYGREMNKQHEYYEGVRKRHEAEVETLKKEHKEALQQVTRQRDEEVKLQQIAFDENLVKSRLHYEEQVKGQRQAHELALKNNAVHLQEKINSLESDLVDNSDDFRPATDDSLKTSYGKLKVTVEQITEPFNLGVVAIPQNWRLDPDNFLGREGKGQTRVLLRSIVWAKLMDGFFSSPFGFGSFGSGSGKTLLVELYSAWRKLFDDGPSTSEQFYLGTQ